MTIAYLTDEQKIHLSINKKMDYPTLKSVIKDLIRVYNNQTDTTNFMVSKETIEQFMKEKKPV